jgi:hypothetical protein
MQFFTLHFKEFLVSSKSVTLSWSFATDQDGMPETRSQVWSKLSSGETSLSPYATWEVQLLHKHGNFSHPLLSQAPKSDESSTPQDQISSIWLELNGQGSYVTANAIPVADLRRFYGPNLL